MTHKWESIFKPGDRVTTPEGEGIVDVVHVSPFLDHSLQMGSNTTKDMRENSSGYYGIAYRISFDGIPKDFPENMIQLV